MIVLGKMTVHRILFLSGFCALLSGCVGDDGWGEANSKASRPECLVGNDAGSTQCRPQYDGLKWSDKGG